MSVLCQLSQIQVLEALVLLEHARRQIDECLSTRAHELADLAEDELLQEATEIGHALHAVGLEGNRGVKPPESDLLQAFLVDVEQEN